jgi:hypothetical protein
MTNIERVKPDEVVQATVEQAQAATDMARQGAEALWEGLAQLVKIQGWAVLGYADFRSWARAELDLSKSTADKYLRKTNKLIELAEETGMAVGKLQKRIPVRSVSSRKPASPVLASMRAAERRLRTIPILTSPDERTAAKALHDALGKLLES